MTPEQISIINTVALILERIGTWPVGTVLVAVAFGPWVMMYFIARGQEKRFDAVAQMYKDNVKLVEQYEKLAKGLQEMIVWCTQTMTGVKDIAENNLYCPIVRKGAKQKEVDQP